MSELSNCVEFVQQIHEKQHVPVADSAQLEMDRLRARVRELVRARVRELEAENESIRLNGVSAEDAQEMSEAALDAQDEATRQRDQANRMERLAADLQRECTSLRTQLRETEAALGRALRGRK